MNKMFSEHEFGIFLEDDVLLSPTFLKFAEEIFLKYRNDERVGHINASNFIPDFKEPSSILTTLVNTHMYGDSELGEESGRNMI